MKKFLKRSQSRCSYKKGWTERKENRKFYSWYMKRITGYPVKLLEMYSFTEKLNVAVREGSCTMGSFIICTHHQILLGRSNQGEWGGQGMWHEWERGETCTGLWWDSPKGKDHMEDEGVDGRVGSKWILGRLVGGWGWSGFTWVRIGTIGGLSWMRWWTFVLWRHGVSLLVHEEWKSVRHVLEPEPKSHTVTCHAHTLLLWISNYHLTTYTPWDVSNLRRSASSPTWILAPNTGSRWNNEKERGNLNKCIYTIK
jgi:hypothetical protein